MAIQYLPNVYLVHSPGTGRCAQTGCFNTAEVPRGGFALCRSCYANYVVVLGQVSLPVYDGVVVDILSSCGIPSTVFTSTNHTEGSYYERSYVQ